ncbi:MAG: hypothetical protein NZ822_01705 [Patescibacteria group bacterium]|nr:hypothetical protein [Patescibacteria group bacterium]
MTKNNLYFLLFIIFTSLNFSLSQEFLPVEYFTLNGVRYVFTAYRASPEEIVLIYKRQKETKDDPYSRDMRAKITGRIINFENDEAKIRAIFEEKNNRIRLTTFTNKKNKTARSLNTRWLPLNEISTHTETFKIENKTYTITFPIYKNQIRVIKEYNKDQSAVNFKFVTNDKFKLSSDKVDLGLEIEAITPYNNKDNLPPIGKRLFDLDDMTLINFLINQNSKYGKLILIPKGVSIYDILVYPPLMTIYQDGDKINIVYVEIAFKQNGHEIAEDRLVEEIIHELRSPKIDGPEINEGNYYNVFRAINSVLMKYERIVIVDESITSEDKLQSMMEEEKLVNNNYNFYARISGGDIEGFKSRIFFFPHFKLTFIKSYEPLFALLGYNVKIHPLQRKIERRLYSKSPYSNKFESLFDLIFKNFAIYDLEGKLISHLKVNGYFHQKINIQLPKVDLDYILKKLEEAGYTIDDYPQG